MMNGDGMVGNQNEMVSPVTYRIVAYTWEGELINVMASRLTIEDARGIKQEFTYDGSCRFVIENDNDEES